ncbi:MAG: hypothetical protein IIY21_06245 [Clostridiales bacterium]|nr:hypothetical protein [Clostridiales bacterium]
MGKIPKSFTVTLGGRTLLFLYEKDIGMGGTYDSYYYSNYATEDIALGFSWVYIRERDDDESHPIFRCQFTCMRGRKNTWANTHLKNYNFDPFYDFPTLESAITGFKGFLKSSYISKRASPKKKANMPFGL